MQGGILDIECLPLTHSTSSASLGTAIPLPKAPHVMSVRHPFPFKSKPRLYSHSHSGRLALLALPRLYRALRPHSRDAAFRRLAPDSWTFALSWCQCCVSSAKRCGLASERAIWNPSQVRLTVPHLPVRPESRPAFMIIQVSSVAQRRFYRYHG